MTTPNDIITEALIAQAQAYAVLVQLLETREVLPRGTVREALDHLIERSQDAPLQHLNHLNDILRQLAPQPPG